MIVKPAGDLPFCALSARPEFELRTRSAAEAVVAVTIAAIIMPIGSGPRSKVFMALTRFANGRLATRRLRTIVGRSAIAARASITTTTAGTPAVWPAGSARAAASAAIAGGVFRKVFGKFQQLGAIELAVTVGVELHRMLDDPLWRGRSLSAARLAVAATPPGRAVLIRPISRIAAATWSAGAAVRTRRVASSVTFLTSTWATIVRSGSSRSAGTIWPALAGPALSRTTRPTCRSQFVLSEFAVAIFIELLEGRRRVGDFLLGELPVVVRVERFHKGIGWMPMSAAAGRALRPVLTVARTLTIAFVVSLGGPLGRLGHNGHRAERTNHAD